MGRWSRLAPEGCEWEEEEPEKQKRSRKLRSSRNSFLCHRTSGGNICGIMYVNKTDIDVN